MTRSYTPKELERKRASARRRRLTQTAEERERENTRRREQRARIRAKKDAPDAERCYRAHGGLPNTLDAKPFADWVALNFPNVTAQALARRFKVSDRYLRCVRNGAEPYLNVSWLDGILTGALGRPDLLNAIYPIDPEPEE